MSNPTSRRRQSALQLASRSREVIRGFRTQVVGIVTLALVLAVLGAADPLVMKYLFDALANAQTSVLPWSIVALLSIEIGRAALTRLLSIQTWKVRVGVDFQMRERLVG